MASLRQRADASFAARAADNLQAMGWSPSLTYWTAAVPEVLDPSSVYGQYPQCLVVWPGESMLGISRKAFRCGDAERSVIGRPDLDGTWSYKATHDDAFNHFICEKTL